MKTGIIILGGVGIAALAYYAYKKSKVAPLQPVKQPASDNAIKLPPALPGLQEIITPAVNTVREVIPVKTPIAQPVQPVYVAPVYNEPTPVVISETPAPIPRAIRLSGLAI